jgi:hypothetical protein
MRVLPEGTTRCLQRTRTPDEDAAFSGYQCRQGRVDELRKPSDEPLLILAAAGFCLFYQATASNTLIQAMSPEAMRGRAIGILPMLILGMIDGEPGAVWVAGGQVRVAFVFTIEDARVSGIDLVMDPARLAELDVKID